MFRIVRFPSVLEPFFRSLTTEFHWDHAQYFRNLVLVMAFAWGRRNVQNLYRHMEVKTHRSRYNNFFLVGRFDEAMLLRQKAYALLSRIKVPDGDGLYLIVDDSKKRKRGKKMQAVDFVHDCVSGKSMLGHQYVVAVLKVGSHVIPWGITLYVKKERCKAVGVKFRKTTQMAADLIRAFVPPKGVRVFVLFDSYYLCTAVVNACREKGFRFISTLKDNRNLFRNGTKLKTGRYKKTAYKNGAKRHVSFPRENDREASFSYVDAGWLEVGDLGLLHVVFSRKNGDRKILGLVTDDPELKPKEILRIYAERWSVEVFFKDAKQHLGLGEYQNRPYRAAVIHLHLVCFAYALLTHLRIEGEKGKRRKHAARMSTSEAQNELRRLVWRDLVQYLEELPSGDSVVKELDRLLLVA